MLAPARTDRGNMGQNDPAGDGADAERPSGEASSVTMEEFEEMLRRIITAPPKTYEEVKLGKRRRRDGATNSLFECGSACGSHLTVASPKGAHDRRGRAEDGMWTEAHR